MQLHFYKLTRTVVFWDLFLCNTYDGVVKEARKIAVWEMTDKFPYAALPCSSRTLYNHFVSAFKFDCYTRESGARNFYKFLTCDRSYNAGLGLFDSPPYSDHALVFWRRAAACRVYAFHPYAYLPEQERELARWCRARSLTYQIYPEQYSFYYPGHTRVYYTAGVKTKQCIPSNCKQNYNWRVFYVAYTHFS